MTNIYFKGMMTKFEDEFINDRMEDQMMKWIILQLVRK